MGTRPTIYLHSTWRCASTYVWAKFRGSPQHYCYFEPLNEHLADVDNAFIDRFRPWSFAHHPELEKPYLDEFRPLVSPQGGIEGFPAALTFGNFHLDPTASHPQLTSYFTTLERFATENGLAPVFGCVRTDLRTGWFRANLPGVHIALRRNPRRQFLSCLAQGARGNPYFLQRGPVILDCNKEDPLFAPIRALVDLAPIGDHLRQPFLESGQAPQWSELYLISYFLHRLAADEAAQAHLILDMDQISTEPAAARRAESAIRELTGTAVSFADCRIERYADQLSRADPIFAALEATVDASLDAAPRAAA